MGEKKNFLGSMDIVKLVCAFFVIAIHTGPFYEYNEYVTFFIVRVFGRLAVPYFFMCAGYFFVVNSIRYDETKEGSAKTGSDKYLLKYAYHILTSYCLWSLVYLFKELPEQVVTYNSLVKGTLVYIWRFFFVGSFYHLWFLIALLIATVFLYFAYKKKRIGTLLVIALVLYLIGLFGDSYYGLLPEGTGIKSFVDTYLTIFDTTRNGIFFGTFFLTLGGYLARPNRWMTNYVLYDENGNLDEIADGVEIKVIIAFVISILFLIGEAMALELLHIGMDYNMYISLVPATFCLFLLVKEFNIYTKRSTAERIRDYSMGIYFVHPLFIIAFERISHSFGYSDLYTPTFVVVTILSVISVVVYYRLKRIFI